MNRPHPNLAAADAPAPLSAAPVWLGRDAPLRLELVLREPPPPPGEDPFVVLSDDPARARVYLGRIMAGPTTVLREVAVKLQPRRGEPSGIEGLALTPAARDQRWLAEWRHYAALAGSGAATPVLFVEPGEARAGRPPQPRPWPPLLFCAVQRRLVPALSPAGRVLRVCRDAKVLARAGLPPYGSGPTFLWDPDEAAGEPVFYQVPGNPDEPLHPRAQGLDACLRAMADLALEPLRAIDPATPDGLERLAEAAAALPCMTHDACRTELAGPHAATHWEPWLLDESWALVLELNAFHYDEFCDVLGGIDARTFDERYRGPASALGRRLRLDRPAVRRQLGEGPSARRLLFDQDASGLDALEVFRLKWGLFAQTVEAVLAYHRLCGAPHLRLSPAHVMVQVEETGGGLPAHWHFSTRLVSLGSPTLQLDGFDDPPELFVPPIGSDPLYESELVRNSGFGIAQRGDFLLAAIEDAGVGRVRLRAQIHHEGIGLRRLTPKDHLLVSLGRHLVGDAALDLLAAPDPDKDSTPRIIYAVSLPLRLTPEKRAAMERLRGIRVPNATFRLLPALHAPCDLYSLGMLLYRALVVNDAQGIGEVALALEELRQDLASLAEIECDESQDPQFWDALIRGHRQSEVADVFDRRNVFYHAHQRDEARPNAIPKPLWHEALAIGLRLTTQFENFSFCAHHGDFDPSYPAQKIEALARRVDQLSRKLDAALFALTARNAEVRQALERVAAETVLR